MSVNFIKNCCRLFSTDNVISIHAQYDGSGDSGDLYAITVAVHPTRNEVEAHLRSTSNLAAPPPAVKTMSFRNWSADVMARGNSLITKELCDEFEEALFQLLPGGWEINDGSYGEIHVDIATEAITHDHNERYTDVRSETFNY
jgi:hypothetical protein